MKVNQKKILPVLICLAAAAVIFHSAFFSHTSSVRKKNQYPGKIAAYQSQTDRDGDGIDDQTDILESAVAYIETRPKYKSRYYEGGYPDDGYGTCTDLAAAALKGAGHDLRELVDEDIHVHPERYEVDEPDKNIDYRRVRNLSVWFADNAISCSMDLSDIEDWQGGDIVIFENHIGIVSDRRNCDGIPYVIHHNNSIQVSYEEDILEKRNDIAGHYRVS